MHKSINQSGVFLQYQRIKKYSKNKRTGAGQRGIRINLKEFPTAIKLKQFEQQNK